MSFLPILEHISVNDKNKVSLIYKYHIIRTAIYQTDIGESNLYPAGSTFSDKHVYKSLQNLSFFSRKEGYEVY